MLINVKSSFVLKKIFSNIYFEIVKLNIIQYNKSLQKKLNITIENYKNSCKKYKYGERNGDGKEYNLYNAKIFEGKYLDGKKNGKGIEYYYNGKVKFIGEYLNGKKWNGKGYDRLGSLLFELKDGKGYVKEYFNDESLIYEGEYLNGERNGKGKEYYKSDIIIYDGEYSNGKRHGKGKEYNVFNKLIFEGEYYFGFRKKGKEYNIDYYEFEGDYRYNKKWNGIGYINFMYSDKKEKIHQLNNGNGIIREYDIITGEMIFEGEYLNGKRNGKGKEYGAYNRLIFEGEYMNGKKMNGKWNFINSYISGEIKNGKGYIKQYDSNNIVIFEGEFLNGEKNGFGKEYNNIRTLIFEGRYLDGMKNGNGIEYHYNKKIKFQGEYKLGKIWNGKGYDIYGNLAYEIKNGKGFVKEYNSVGNLDFEGEYINGERNGKGKEYNLISNLEYEGEYINNKRNGIGKEYDIRGNLIYMGEYINGHKI